MMDDQPSIDAVVDTAQAERAFKKMDERWPYEKEAYAILMERYAACDEEGHLAPDQEQNRCNNCYRHLIYATPRTDARYAGRKGLSPMEQPLDGPVVIEKGRKEIAEQRFRDQLDGIRTLTDELLAKRGMK